MQLFLSVGGRWKCIEVSLISGSVPCIGGTALGDQKIESALWFKVLVLESVCVDCNERVVSWSVKGTENDVNLHRQRMPVVVGKEFLLQTGSPNEPGSSYVHTRSDGDPSEKQIPLDNNEGDDAREEGKELLFSSDRLKLSLTEDGHSPPPPLLTPSSYSMSPLLSLNQLLSSSIGSMEGYHSLMAPQGSTTSFCTDDLQALFELAEELLDVDEVEERAVQSKKWLRLLHCYLLPLITFHREDLSAVALAHDSHVQVLHCMDEQLEELSSRNLKLKSELALIFSQLLVHVRSWKEEGCCSLQFLALIISDIKFREQEARSKIQSCASNIELSERLSKVSLSQNTRQQFQKDKNEAEKLLLEMLQLRSFLEGTNTTGVVVQGSGLQWDYTQLHAELEELRRKSSSLSSEKVLALSVREAIEHTMTSLVNGHVTSGMDVGLQGGHSTDVLQEASNFPKNNYLTWRDQIQMLLQDQSTPLARLHEEFCQLLHKILLARPQKCSSAPSPHTTLLWEGKSLEEVSDTRSLACIVRIHFEKMVDHVCAHFNDHSTDFVQRSWLCYERIFFEYFSDDILSWYQVEQAKGCEQLLINAIGLSIVDPRELDLGLARQSWPLLFPTRSHVSASLLYQEVMEMSDFLSLRECCAPKMDSGPGLPYLDYFSGVTSDLSSLPLAISPLDRLQLLISAFRKAMAGLSKLKLKPYQDSEESSYFDASLVAVSCDDILPVLVLIMLQLPPWLLAILHINCCLLNDFMAPFLSPGWHGYSLTAFSSTLHIINKL